jgi:hypothetical protein
MANQVDQHFDPHEVFENRMERFKRTIKKYKDG